MRVLQGVGGALLMANSSAIITDAFPVDQRGLALGLNMVAGIAGSFLGLVIGGVLAPIDWRLVFLVSVPVSLFGTVWAYLKLRDTGVRHHGGIDWWGNLTFGVGLVAILVGITYGIQPYAGHIMGWTNPWVLAALIGGAAVLASSASIETRVAHPMFHLDLFRIRAFTAGNVASLLSGLGRGGLMFILIIWLQGIWLPRHGYSFESTPLWAGIFMLPMTVGFLIAGPVSGYLSDRFGARPFATGGMVVAALSFVWLLAPAGRLHLLAVRRRAPGQRPRHGPVRLAEPGGHHERPAAAPSWRRGRDEHDVPERGHGALDRDLLLPHGHRARRRRCRRRWPAASPLTA